MFYVYDDTSHQRFYDSFLFSHFVLLLSPYPLCACLLYRLHLIFLFYSSFQFIFSNAQHHPPPNCLFMHPSQTPQLHAEQVLTG